MGMFMDADGIPLAFSVFDGNQNEQPSMSPLEQKIIRSMDMLIAPGEGYIPTYTRTDITDALHDAFGFRTDYQITSQKNMRKILNQTKKK